MFDDNFDENFGFDAVSDGFNNYIPPEVTSPQFGFTDPMQAEYAMAHYRGPKENYYFTADDNLLLQLGFTIEEINILKSVVEYYGSISTNKLTTPPFVLPQIMVARIMYAYNICMGKKEVDTTDPLSISKHFKKLAQISGNYQMFNAMYVPHRNIQIIPRVAVVAGLPQGNFYILNSTLYDKMEATYKVDKIAQEWVTIYSERRMRVGVNDRLNNSYENREWGIPDILKVEEVGDFKSNKPWKIKIHKSHCRLCNRFMIMISTKKMTPGVTPHHGCYQVVLSNGQLVYVYAKTTDYDNYGNPKDSVPTPSKDTIMWDYGFYRDEIPSKLNNALNALASKYQIVYSLRMEGETGFKEIPEYNGMTNIRGNGYEDSLVESEDDQGDIILQDDTDFGI